MATIRQLESANNYQAQAAGSDASGAYQFLDHTWATWVARAGYPNAYRRAYVAPPHIQDDVAATYITAILAAHDGDWASPRWADTSYRRSPCPTRSGRGVDRRCTRPSSGVTRWRWCSTKAGPSRRWPGRPA